MFSIVFCVVKVKRLTVRREKTCNISPNMQVYCQKGAFCMGKGHYLPYACCGCAMATTLQIGCWASDRGKAYAPKYKRIAWQLLRTQQNIGKIRGILMV